MFKEIVTKAVIGKGKKTFRNSYELITLDKIDAVLGCWVINHKMNGTFKNDNVVINGSFDVNIWYSYENNTKTAVEARMVEYTEEVHVNLKENTNLSTDSEILLNALKSPTVVDVNSIDNKISYEIEKEIGIEIIGDAKVKIQVINDEDDYESLNEEVSDNELDSLIDKEIDTNYLR